MERIFCSRRERARLRLMASVFGDNCSIVEARAISRLIGRRYEEHSTSVMKELAVKASDLRLCSRTALISGV